MLYSVSCSGSIDRLTFGPQAASGIAVLCQLLLLTDFHLHLFNATPRYVCGRDIHELHQVDSHNNLYACTSGKAGMVEIRVVLPTTTAFHNFTSSSQESLHGSRADMPLPSYAITLKLLSNHHRPRHLVPLFPPTQDLYDRQREQHRRSRSVLNISIIIISPSQLQTNNYSPPTRNNLPINNDPLLTILPPLPLDLLHHTWMARDLCLHPRCNKCRRARTDSCDPLPLVRKIID